MTEPDHITSTRAAYDHSADQYVAAVGTRISADFETPVDLAMLDAFAETVGGQAVSDDRPRVLDVGCGSGRATAYLAERGLAVSGVDLSERMVLEARAAHPHLDFEVGALHMLPVEGRSIAGAAYWYSIIATPIDHLTNAWRELDRALAPDGIVLVAFQAGGGDAVTRPDAYGSASTLTLYRHSVEAVAESLRTAGFEVFAQTVRQPMLPHETTPQAFLLVHRTVDSTT